MDVRDGVAELTLNRPARLNAFDDEQYEEVRLELAALRDDEDVRAVLVTGAGRAFSAGQDMSEMGGARCFTPFVDELSAFDKPLVAAVNGLAVGVGLTLLLHCDVVYVAERARLRAPFVALGLVPEAASSFLLQAWLGPQRAAEIFFTSRWIEAEEAVRLGLALRALPEGELLPAARATARAIAEGPLGSLRETKRLLLASRAEAMRAARTAEDAAMFRRIGTPESREAIRAFLEKKRPG